MSDQISTTHSERSLKVAIEYFPLLGFILGYVKPDWFRWILPESLYGNDHSPLFVATAVVIATTLLSLVVAFVVLKHIPARMAFTALIVVIFGAMTLYWQNGELIKIKLTFLYAVFAMLLLGGLALDKVLLPHVLDGALKLSPEGWRKLTRNWGVFFLILAILNEIIRRTQSDSFWVAFKFPGTLIIIFIFTLTQVPIIVRHEDKSS